MRTLTNILLLALFVCIQGVFPGCKDSEPFTVDSAIKNALGADDKSPAQRARDIFDIEDPDLRRQAVESFMKREWALKEPYLERFAQLTDPKNEPSASVRAVAVRALGEANNRKYEKEIVACLYDKSPIVRWDAACVLKDMPIDNAVDRLRSLAINDDSNEVRAAAADALRHYRTDEVFRTLLRCLEDFDLNVRMRAHDSLVNQTGQDLGMDPRSWSKGEIGRETLPEPKVVYKKRRWWDWMGFFSHSDEVPDQKKEEEGGRPWWDWFGVTDGS